MFFFSILALPRGCFLTLSFTREPSGRIQRIHCSRVLLKVLVSFFAFQPSKMLWKECTGHRQNL